MPNAPSGAGLAAASCFQQYLRSRHSFAPNNSHRLSCSPGSCSAPYSRITMASASWALRNAEVREATNVLYRAGGHTVAATAQVRTWHRADNFYAAATLSVVGGVLQTRSAGPAITHNGRSCRPATLVAWSSQSDQSSRYTLVAKRLRECSPASKMILVVEAIPSEVVPHISVV
jgi:hypothetical protein